MDDLMLQLREDIDMYRSKITNHVDDVTWMIQEADDWIEWEDIERDYNLALPFRQLMNESPVQFAERITSRIDNFDLASYEKQLKGFRAFRDEESLEHVLNNLSVVLQRTKGMLSKDLRDIKTQELADLKEQHKKITASKTNRPKSQNRDV